ncbi:UNVERIFIED_CONTAM: putative ribonuclease H protein [Sesamum calycinum]|uniref:Ribonuclease H protein n=1 Tax=Sesamum calycinum TaxID=2727403 RepID=A0AAW2KE44_9LAMI
MPYLRGLPSKCIVLSHEPSITFISWVKANLIRASHWKGDRHVASLLKIPLPPHKISSRISIVKRIKPDRGWFKLNTDGASKGNPDVVGAGGIIRNHLGQIVLAFQEHLGLTSNTTAELKAIYRGVKLFIDSNIRKIWVETDANVALKLISSPFPRALAPSKFAATK